MTDALILTVAPNGAYKQPSDHPALPITPEALAQMAKACLDAGAAVLHLHVRKPDGAHSLAPEDYCAAIATARAAVGNDLVVQITTEAAGVYQPPAQIAAAHALQPEAVSVGLRELTRPVLDKRLVGDFFTHLQHRRVMTQVILYDTEDLQEWLALRAEGVVPDGAWSVLFVLAATARARPPAPATCCPSCRPGLATRPHAPPGPCAPSARRNTAAPWPPPPWAAMSAWVSRTTSSCATAAPPPTTPPWSARPPKACARWV